MFDIFTEEIERLIKEGITNLYWYKPDLKKAWLRSGVDKKICEDFFKKTNKEGSLLTKRELMSELYQALRSENFNKRLEISRNFVRFLVEHKNFVPDTKDHNIIVAEQCALKLKEIIAKQIKEREIKDLLIIKKHTKPFDYFSELEQLKKEFINTSKIEGQQRGYNLEKIFSKLMHISNIPVIESFKIEGEQLDGAIKFESHYYLIELKWTSKKVNIQDLGSFYIKVEGKMDSVGIFISMNGFSDEIIHSLPKGRKLKVIFLDGIHFTNVITGIYTFKELLECAISEASLKGNIYCNHYIQ